MKANHLRIKVTENGAPKADVTLKAELASQLSDLVPPSVLAAVQERNIDLDQIAQNVIDSDFEAGILFELEEGSKEVTVWLE